MSNSLFVFLTIAGIVVSVCALLVAGLSHHKKTSSRSLNMIGAIGIVETDLDPEGGVIINGELWRARLRHEPTIWSSSRIRVVGVAGHLLLVEPESNEL